MKKEFKNLVVRKPEEINQEYSEILGKLGAFRLERAEIARIGNVHVLRGFAIDEEEALLLKRVLELKEEMTESQREIQRKTEISKGIQKAAEAGSS